MQIIRKIRTILKRIIKYGNKYAKNMQNRQINTQNTQNMQKKYAKNSQKIRKLEKYAKIRKIRKEYAREFESIHIIGGQRSHKQAADRFGP